MSLQSNPAASRFKRSPFGIGYVMPPVMEVKDVDAKEGIVTGYFAAFGNLDSHRDVIVQGAFAKTISEWGPKGRKRIAHLMDHNPTHRVAVIKELMEDAHGLRFVSKFLGQNHSKARDALIEYEEGAITEHSIGFDLVKWEMDADADILKLTELRLYEGSGVTWGANMDTPVVDIKALESDPLLVEQMSAQMAMIERVLKREITDERAMQLEEQIVQLESSLAILKQALAEPRTRTQGEPLEADVLRILGT